MARKAKEPPSPKPPGCRTCLGAPWIMGDGGMQRCSCPRGVWYLQQDRQRVMKERRQLGLVWG